MKESELAKIISDKFEKDGYEIYSEVYNTNKGAKNRADIVMVKDGKYTVIETKISFGLSVIEQSFLWKPYSHFSYIAMPASRKKRKFGYDFCRDLGIGVIEVSKAGKVNIIYESSITTEPSLPSLYEEQKTQVAGSKPTKDSYITPFKITRNKIIEYIKVNNDIPLLTAIKNIDHHYSSNSSAKNALAKLIKYNVIDNISSYKKGKILYVKFIG
jgi:hypothetical protein